MAPDEQPAGLVWVGSSDPDALRTCLTVGTSIRWVQLPSAGVEWVVKAGLLDHSHLWTCAKGAYGEPVAEHALMLALAGLRMPPERVKASRWGTPGGTSLYDEDITIVGSGGIATALIELLAPFRVHITAVHRSQAPIRGAHRTVAITDLHEALHGALVVFLALALTSETTALMGWDEFHAMDERSWLVNVARGGIVDTDQLVEALSSGTIAGAALDVVEPEPLPESHPLWAMTNCIITPHTADTSDMIQPRLAKRIADNVRRLANGDSLLGMIDVEAGY